MLSWLSWILDEWNHIRKFWRLAAVLVIGTASFVWFLTDQLYKLQISNLQSLVVLQKKQLEAGTNASSPLPIYPLGGSNILIYNNLEWKTQDTARKVEIDWNSLIGVEAYAVLWMRTEGKPTSWVQARIVNVTNGREVVATTDRHKDRKIQVRLLLPRAIGAKTYSMEIRGESAGLEGHIELLRTTQSPR